MAQRTRKPAGTAGRVARHRRKLATAGARRVEVTVPARDVELVRSVAARLRAGGEQASRIRKTVGPLVGAGIARSGKELVAFFRSSPLVGVELQFERDRTPGRTIDL